ncbi:hypothetical protein BB559_002110 [Furculomyces boomerangus]|uniref:BAP29/BAP31 transmembrane domain-containing protein n=1 Tax=Furculomyces boomerangus TaxID=61424 RepID=A0A2T9YY61_9FUNG|nr:hypothetical protein BB559_002110 [Furculomyces boomerangus]
MATVQYTIVFGIMVSEIFLFFMLMMPMPDKWKQGLFKVMGHSKSVCVVVVYRVYIVVGVDYVDDTQIDWGVVGYQN